MNDFRSRAGTCSLHWTKNNEKMTYLKEKQKFEIRTKNHTINILIFCLPPDQCTAPSYSKILILILDNSFGH